MVVRSSSANNGYFLHASGQFGQLRMIAINSRSFLVFQYNKLLIIYFLKLSLFGSLCFSIKTKKSDVLMDLVLGNFQPVFPCFEFIRAKVQKFSNNSCQHNRKQLGKYEQNFYQSLYKNRFLTTFKSQKLVNVLT